MRKTFPFYRLFFILFLLFAGVLVHLASGSSEIPLEKVIGLLYQKISGSEWGEDYLYGIILWNGRMPRLIVAFFVGASLSISGAVMQALFKNPMASPDVTGVASASVFGAILSIVTGAASYGFYSLAFFSIVSAIITLFMVYLLSTSYGKTSCITLLLVGMAVSLFFASMVAFLITIKLHDWETGKTIVAWTLGDLNDRQWEHVCTIFTTFLIGTGIILFFTRDLNILMHGEEIASNLGVDVNHVRFLLLLACAFLTGGAIGVAGMIGFIGLIIPHIVRSLFGNDHYILLPFSILCGGIFLLYCDLLLRIAFTMDIKIGALTGLIGSPYFFYLILKNRRKFSAFG